MRVEEKGREKESERWKGEIAGSRKEDSGKERSNGNQTTTIGFSILCISALLLHSVHRNEQINTEAPHVIRLKETQKGNIVRSF